MLDASADECRELLICRVVVVVVKKLSCQLKLRP